MDELLYLLNSIAIYSKDVHYNVGGECALSIHKFADDIYGPIYGFIDEIKEAFYLRHNRVVPRGTFINEQSVQYVPKDAPRGENRVLVGNLRALLEMTDTKLNEIDVKESGTNDLLGRIGSHLQKYIGLSNLIIKD